MRSEHLLRGAVASACVALLATATPSFGADTVYTGPLNGTWDLDANWRQAGTDLTFGTGDDVFIQPGTADAAIVLDGSTVDLNSTESVLEVQVSHAANSADPSATHGTARLNVGAGAALTTSGNSSGIRVGRLLDAGQTVGTSRGEIVQTGGSVNIAQGSNGLRLSEADGPFAGTAVADSYYEISGGSLTARSVVNTIVADLRIGRRENVWGTAEFHVNGSGATEIRFLDIQMAGNVASLTGGTGSGTSIMHFSIDAGGVETVVAEDEFQFRGGNETLGQNLLQLDLIGEAPEGDLLLIQADRLNTNGITGNAALERFTGMPDGSVIIRQFGDFEYQWTLEYGDGSDDGTLDAFVMLDFVSKTLVPEPTSLALLGLGSMALLRRRRGA